MDAERSCTRAPALLVGRERERGILDQVSQRMGDGTGGLVLITGEEGIGKTALVAAAARDAAARGASVLTGRCYDPGLPPPYSLWLDLFQHYDAPALTVPPPVPFASGYDLQGISDLASLTTQMRAWFSALAARGPCVLVLEDLHWADPASLDLLRILARALPSLPILVLATYREDALNRDHPLHLMLPHLVRETDATRITLLPLSEADVGMLITARYAMPPPQTAQLAAYLYGRAEGNAFFTTELLRTLEACGALHATATEWQLGDLTVAPIPTFVRQMIDARIGRLGRDARDLLEVAAMIGHEAPLSLWVRASGGDEDAVLRVAERAIAARLLLHDTGERVRFVHAFTREALSAGAPLLRRRQLHRQIADALIGQPNIDPGIVASHLQGAGDPRACSWFVRAADRAEQACAYKSAVNYLEAALTLLPSEPGTEIRQAEIHLRIAPLGRFAPWTVPHIQEGLRLATDHGDTALAVVARLRLCFAALGLVDIRAMCAMQAEALAALAALPADTLAALARVDALAASLPRQRETAARLVAIAGDFAEMFRLLDIAPDARYAAPQFADPTAYGALGTAYIALGRPEDALAAYAESVRCSLALEQHGVVGAHYEWRLHEYSLVFAADNPMHLAAIAAESEREYRQDAAVPAVFPMAIARVSLLALHGDWDAAIALIEDFRNLVGHSGWWGMYLHLIGTLARARGDRAGAEAIVRELFPAGPETAPGGCYLQNALRVQRLALALALDDGDHARAHAWLVAHDRWLAWSGAVLGQAEGALAWATYHRAIKDGGQACIEADRALTLAAAPRQPFTLLAAHRLRGELATDAGAYHLAASHLDAALALADACQAPYERALTQIAHATLAQATSKHADAARMLEEARMLAEQLHARPTIERIDALSSRLPTSAPQCRRPRVRLTEREQEILALIARGQTNSGIGRALSLSPRTVERHITNIYSKIGAQNRADAIAFALNVNRDGDSRR